MIDDEASHAAIQTVQRTLAHRAPVAMRAIRGCLQHVLSRMQIVMMSDRTLNLFQNPGIGLNFSGSQQCSSGLIGSDLPKRSSHRPRRAATTASR